MLGMVDRMLIPKLKCPHCGHEWTPRVENPLKCPRCFKFLKNLEELVVTT